MKKEDIKTIKVCGGNCRFNKIATSGLGSEKVGYNNFRKRKYYYCSISGNRCGKNTTCKLFKNGRFAFESKPYLDEKLENEKFYKISFGGVIVKGKLKK
jgi:hypothetical protein